MTFLVLGAGGQVGQVLLRSLARHGAVVGATRSGHLIDGRPCEVANLDQPDDLPALLDRVRPAAVINAAAYTAVDAAEQDAACARRVNRDAPGLIARWCADHAVPFVHYSTDYVFDGKGSVPYTEQDPTAPLNVYGVTKRDGELAVRDAGGRHLIFRTAWVYAAYGRNFLRTMLRLAADHDSVRVVSDQIGAPTSAQLIADITALALIHPVKHCGTWHLTASGQTSWAGFAEAIFAEAHRQGVLRKVPQVVPISTAEYPTPARRPAWSVLDNRRLQREMGLILPPWQQGLQRVIGELAQDVSHTIG
ncbi:dTDP-4-dehydrorhamnose reductase [Stenotrophomonas oahuensis]|uniref:dTDP-4-dehydrorhamnose reductase n=1 Tax=Stenotrophomonas oahuensis TaxID=3003271 RepID=A0ABY9YJC1_9GAMM|nr:dTDP-4-dehydrorhamnose reductase [Stenotrophomonas sp. A5586]WNH50797.1 dTDP-4-dehydrorhamnose reductase [Stenotrophomonas sp. A5586]